MKSFFNKPKWAATQDDSQGDTGSEFYRRSEQTYSDIVAASREAHKKPKTEAESPQKTTSKHARHIKRPRLSDETDEKDIAITQTPLHAEDRKSSPRPPDSPIVLERAGHGSEEQPNSFPIGTSDSPSMNTPSKNLLGRSVPSPLSQSTNRNMPTQKSALGDSERETTEENTPNRSSVTSKPQSIPPNPPANDPVVQILITSEIPNTKPLLVQRKMTQSLREVRMEWCRRQGFTTGEQASVHLTWKGRRLFDVTTCRSLGIKVESSNSFSGMDDDLDAANQELRIHMEAVTENPILLNRDGSSTHGEDQPSPAPPSPGNQQNEPMKLILRSPGLDDLKIKARPKTIVSKLLSAFRDKHAIAAEDEVSLIFDGDRLDPDTCLGDYDIDDLDMLDVQVKSST
ncbi:uncharacterized protein N7459_005141 [Penicillium hispanicum]|uniref:uncharacterized protein n=1 Tax=Penicillium hispanicum TaxID=1080232 RepID=UPI0025419E6B|nr:uncharacterized protein N7459_005141 [Penicillium hispanicum]KAJ5585341.1 hypothetical protein N7459_005141 [Penicillium hispanicum]